MLKAVRRRLADLEGSIPLPLTAERFVMQANRHAQRAGTSYGAAVQALVRDLSDNELASLADEFEQMLYGSDGAARDAARRATLAAAGYPVWSGPLSLTGFDPGEIDGLLALEDDEKANAAPPLPETPASRPGDLWLLGPHKVLCGDATSVESVARLLGDRKPRLMCTDPPYGIELDSEWRDRAGLNGCGAAEPSYLKKRTKGHTETTISGDTRADWSEAFELVPSLEVAYVWHASKFTREVLDGLLRIGFVHHQQIIWDKGRTVLTRTLYWFQHKPCWFVRKKNAPWFGKAGENSTIWASPSPKFIMGGADEDKYDHPTQKPIELMRRPILNHLRRGELVYDPFLGSGTSLAAAELNERVCYGIELDPKYVDVVIQRWQQLTTKEATLDSDGRTFAQVQTARAVGGSE